MSFTVSLDTAAVMESLETAVARSRLQAVVQLGELAVAIRDSAKQRCPVKTGKLRDSIKITAGFNALGQYYDIGSRLPYAWRIEAGYMDKTDSLGRTFHQPAQPYMRPSILEMSEAWRPNF